MRFEFPVPTTDSRSIFQRQFREAKSSPLTDLRRDDGSAGYQTAAADLSSTGRSHTTEMHIRRHGGRLESEGRRTEVCRVTESMRCPRESTLAQESTGTD